jgi:hypothetical protein
MKLEVNYPIGECAMADEKVAAEGSGLRVGTVDESGEFHAAVGTSDEVGALSVHYRDGQPVIIVTGGSALPGEVVVEDADGEVVAAYRAGEAQQAGARPGTS